MRFADRQDAGAHLADRLAGFARSHPVILALPRGGVVVGSVVAHGLRAPLDLIVVRKIGCPWQPELGVGAIAEGGIEQLDAEMLMDLGLDRRRLLPVVERERRELERRVTRYRGSRPPIDLHGRVAIIVDDGLATGATMLVAIEAARRRGAARVVVAVPVAPPSAMRELRGLADQVIALTTPEWFLSIGSWYDEFPQVSDEEVLGWLRRAAEGMTGEPVGAPPP